MTYCASCNFITVAFLSHLVERSIDGILLNEALCMHCNGSEQSFSASDASGNRWVFSPFCDDKFEPVMFCLNRIFLRNTLYLWDDSFKSSELEILYPISNSICFVFTEVLCEQWLGLIVYCDYKWVLDWKQKQNSYFDN